MYLQFVSQSVFYETAIAMQEVGVDGPKEKKTLKKPHL